MSTIESWAKAIGLERNEEGHPSLGTVLGHIRDAIFEVGLISRGRITSGLKEAYRPLSVDEAALRSTIDEALRLLLLSGDADEFTMGAGRGYAATPQRRIDWGSSHFAVLGSVNTMSSQAIVRRILISERDEAMITTTLDDELGRPDWRSALVELGAADAFEQGSTALFAVAQSLASSGNRYSLDEPQAVAVVSGRSEFFGRAENAPSGRWQRVNGDGCFPAAIRSGYITRYVVLSISGDAVTLWQPPTTDMWRWIVVGATLAVGDPVLRYEPATATLNFLTPPPKQAERAALLTGTQVGPWSWTIDEKAYATILNLMGSNR